MTDKHPYFDLWLHDDAELAAALGSSIQARATLHEWPLSCVQRATLAAGRCVIYKTQVGPTVEAASSGVRAHLVPAGDSHV